VGGLGWAGSKNSDIQGLTFLVFDLFWENNYSKNAGFVAVLSTGY